MAAPILDSIGDPVGYLPYLRSQLTARSNGNSLLARGANLHVLSFIQNRLINMMNEIPRCYRVLAEQTTDGIRTVSRPYWMIYGSLELDQEARRRTYLYLNVIRNVVEILDSHLSDFEAVFTINNFPYLYIQAEVHPQFVTMWAEALRSEQTSQGSSTNSIEDVQLVYLALTRYFIVNAWERFGIEFPETVAGTMRETVINIDELLNMINRAGYRPRMLPFELKCNTMVRRQINEE